MAETADYEALKAPISADKPCGEYLEDTQTMSGFDALRLFGQTVPASEPPDWRDIRSRATDALGKSKDFRLLAHLAACDLRLQGLAALAGLLDVAAHWIEQYWDGVYPPIDDDAIFRRNALNSFADRFAVVDGLRRLSLVSHPQLGRVSLRDIEGGGEQATEGAAVVDVVSVFASASTEDLASLQQQAKAAIASLKRIDAKMRDSGGPEAAPDFDGLLSPLALVDRTVGQQLAARGGADPEAAAAGDQTAGSPGATTVAVGSIRSRQDAVRALDAVAMWFRQNEPSSPVPMFVDRAKRLVSMDFLDILADVAPDGVGQARSAGGIKDN